MCIRDSHRHLEALRAAFARVRRGHSACALVRGRSGMGKSLLLERFVDEVGDQGATVLTGRCYERESVPYKALDAMVDALCAHLLRRGGEAAAEPLPRDIAAALG